MKNMYVKSVKAITIIFVCAAPVLSQAQIEAAPQAPLAGCTDTSFVKGTDKNQITTAGASYTPKCLRVKIGASVTIQASQHHPLAGIPAANGLVNPFEANGHFVVAQTRVMNQAGLFGYYCENHGDSEGDGMAGVILVEE